MDDDTTDFMDFLAGLPSNSMLHTTSGSGSDDPYAQYRQLSLENIQVLDSVTNRIRRPRSVIKQHRQDKSPSSDDDVDKEGSSKRQQGIDGLILLFTNAYDQGRQVIIDEEKSQRQSIQEVALANVTKINICSENNKMQVARQCLFDEERRLRLRIMRREVFDSEEGFRNCVAYLWDKVYKEMKTEFGEVHRTLIIAIRPSATSSLTEGVNQKLENDEKGKRDLLLTEETIAFIKLEDYGLALAKLVVDVKEMVATYELIEAEKRKDIESLWKAQMHDIYEKYILGLKEPLRRGGGSVRLVRDVTTAITGVMKVFRH